MSYDNDFHTLDPVSTLHQYLDLGWGEICTEKKCLDPGTYAPAFPGFLHPMLNRSSRVAVLQMYLQNREVGSLTGNLERRKGGETYMRDLLSTLALCEPGDYFISL